MTQTTPLAELTRVFGRIGLLSFGGPAAQIALMHKELVEDRPWLTEQQFLRALSFCMLLPGPEAMQLATYCGWRMRGVVGGLIGGGLFVLPGAIVIFALALMYSAFGDLPFVRALFLGIQALVVVLVAQALIKLAAKIGLIRTHLIIAALAFVALFAFAVPFPVVIALAALWGAVQPAKAAQMTRPPLRQALRPLLIFGALWALPLLALWIVNAEAFLTLGLFFSRMAVVSFGGAYALLAYMAQEVVTQHGWLSADQMMDALGLAETTPGPLILVTQFVGHLAGQTIGGTWGLIAAGLLTLWVTFIPCFLWIFAGAPMIDWLETQPRISAALSAVSAAVLGVIANLALWFAAHVLFAQVGALDAGPLQMIAPQLSSLRLDAVVLVATAAALIWGLKWPMLRALPVMALLGLAASYI